MHYLLIGMPGPFELLILALFGLLIFGKRLPEVGRSLGKGIVEFKKGLKSIDDEVDLQASATQHSVTQSNQQATPALPASAPAQRFDPYTGKPVAYQFDPYTGKPVDPQATASEKTQG